MTNLDDEHLILCLLVTCCFRWICGISMQDRIMYRDVLKQCPSFSVDFQPALKRLRWFDDVCAGCLTANCKNAAAYAVSLGLWEQC